MNRLSRLKEFAEKAKKEQTHRQAYLAATHCLELIETVESLTSAHVEDGGYTTCNHAGKCVCERYSLCLEDHQRWPCKTVLLAQKWLEES